MGNLTVNNGGIIVNTNIPNIDLRYGPYKSLEIALAKLGGVLTPGLTIGIERNNKITEYIAVDNNGTIEFEEKVNLSGKQDSINDIEEIRSGALAGLTAIQPESLPGALTEATFTDSQKQSLRETIINRSEQESEAKSYIVLDPNIPIKNQITEPNTIYEINTEFRGDITKTYPELNTKISVGSNNFWIGNSYELESDKSIALSVEISALEENLTKVYSTGGTGKIIRTPGTYYIAKKDFKFYYKYSEYVLDDQEEGTYHYKDILNTLATSDEIVTIDNIKYIKSASSIELKKNDYIEIQDNSFILLDNTIATTEQIPFYLRYKNTTENIQTVYILRKAEIELQVQDVITFPSNSTIYFNGGKLSDFSIIGDNLSFSGDISFNVNCRFGGTINQPYSDPRWFGAKSTPGDINDWNNYVASEDAAIYFNAAIGILLCTRGYLYVPAGLWSIKSAINYSPYPIKIKGDSKVSSILQAGPPKPGTGQWYPIIFNINSDEKASFDISDLYLTGGDLFGSTKINGKTIRYPWKIQGTAFYGLRGCGSVRNIKLKRLGIFIQGSIKYYSVIDNIYAVGLQYSFLSRETEFNFRSVFNRSDISTGGNILMDSVVTNCYISSTIIQGESKTFYDRIAFNGSISSSAISNCFMDYWAILFSTPNLSSNGSWFNNRITNNIFDRCLRFNSPTGLAGHDNVICNNSFNHLNRAERTDSSSNWVNSRHPDKAKKVAFITLCSSSEIYLTNNVYNDIECILTLITLNSSNAINKNINTDLTPGLVILTDKMKTSSNNPTVGSYQLRTRDYTVYNITKSDQYINIYALKSLVPLTYTDSYNGSTFNFGDEYYNLFFPRKTRDVGKRYYYEDISSMKSFCILSSSGVEAIPYGIEYALDQTETNTVEKKDDKVYGCYASTFHTYYENRGDYVRLYNLGICVSFKTSSGQTTDNGVIKSTAICDNPIVWEDNLPFFVESLEGIPEEQLIINRVVHVIGDVSDSGSYNYKRYTYNGWVDALLGEQPIKKSGRKKYLPTNYHERYLTIGSTYFNPYTGITYTLCNNPKTDRVSWVGSIGNVNSLDHTNGYKETDSEYPTYETELSDGEMVNYQGKIYTWTNNEWVSN